MRTDILSRDQELLYSINPGNVPDFRRLSSAPEAV